MRAKSYQLLGLTKRKTGQLSPVSPNLLAYSSWKMRRKSNHNGCIWLINKFC